MNNFDLKKFLTENKLTSNSKKLNEADDHLLRIVNDYLSNYSPEELEETLQESPDIILEIIIEYAEEEGLDVPMGEFSESMFSAIDSILEQGLDNIGSKLIELIMNPEMYN